MNQLSRIFVTTKFPFFNQIFFFKFLKQIVDLFLIFFPRFRLFFQLSQSNISSYSYIFFDVSDFYVDAIVFFTDFKWRWTKHARVLKTKNLSVFFSVYWFFSLFLCFEIFFRWMNWVEHWSRPNFVFLPRYRFFFQLSQANSSYSSYISMDVSDLCADAIFFL